MSGLPEVETNAVTGLGSVRAVTLVARLVWLYGGFALAVTLSLLVVLLPFRTLGAFQAQAQEAITGGLAGVVLSTLLMVVTVLASTWLLASARLRHGQGLTGQARWIALRPAPGLAAREGQAVIIVAGAIFACAASRWLWPTGAATGAAAIPNLLGAISIAMGFISLMAERTMAAFPSPQLPEAPTLWRVLFVATIVLAAAGALEILRDNGLHWALWGFALLAVVPWVVAFEVVLRALGRLFLPMPKPQDARAVSASIVLDILMRGPRSPSLIIRDHLGLDFTRSWALSYLTSLIVPAAFATALLCWGLSGLKLIDLDQRAIYERFGAPVGVLGPGIHFVLPWPLGTVRPVEYGAIHEVKVGASLPGAEMAAIAAESIPPSSANHLWDVADPAEAEYLIASRSTDGAQGFQMVDAEIHVLYRTGLADSDAVAAVYGATDSNKLVSYAASRVVAMYFASHALEQVMGAQRDTLAETLRMLLARDVATYRAGVEIIGVHIESVHPPVGAAAAYHLVQAAEINATASIFNETGRARRMTGVAQQEAHQLETSAEAAALERLQQANGEAYKFAADRKANALGSQSFLMEQKFAILTAVLAQKPVTIIDHRLTDTREPFIDLRGSANGAADASSPAATVNSAPAAAPDSDNPQ